MQIENQRVSLIGEPELEFGMRQSIDDPRQGLFLFGPLKEAAAPKRIRVGVIGTAAGLALYRRWADAINKPVLADKPAIWCPFFPGFSEVFGCEWPKSPTQEMLLRTEAIVEAIKIGDRHQAIYNTVSLFVDPILKSRRASEEVVDLWFVVVPDVVHLLGRPLSRVPPSERMESTPGMDLRLAKKLHVEPSLFPEDMDAARPYYFDTDFHHQLKVRLVSTGSVSQVVRESTFEPFVGIANQRRRMQDPATVAWNMATAAYFKAGGKPWRLANVREGVCYVGLTFKTTDRASGRDNACCAAQMFLNSGDGMVFKGAVGPWYSPDRKTFHLSEGQARSLLGMVVDSYRQIMGSPPREVFLHGRTRFDENEWRGFSQAVPGASSVTGVRIQRSADIKLFRPGRYPVLRGTFLQTSAMAGYLWTSGYVPKLQTYPGWEVPSPLSLEITKGTCDMPTIANDVLGLTKLNFNSCIYGDGLPVTLRFADLIGDILTAGPDIPDSPLPFRHYI